MKVNIAIGILCSAFFGGILSIGFIAYKAHQKPTVAELQLQEAKELYAAVSDGEEYAVDMRCQYATTAKQAAEKAEAVDDYKKYNDLAFDNCTRSYINGVKALYGAK